MPHLHDTKLTRYLTDPRYKNTGFEEFLAHTFDHELSDVAEIAALERAYFAEKLASLEEKLPEWLAHILALEEDLVEVLAQMEATGVFVDRGILDEITEEIKAESHKLELEMRELVGEPFNPLSAKQVQYILFEKLGLKTTRKIKTGFSVDAEVLEELGKTCDIANLILRYRAIEKLRGTYTEGLTKEISSVDGRIHTTYNQASTSTGRLSSESPNLQNIPSGEWYAARIKSAFHPEKEGWSFLVADYSQVELRILAILSQDEHLLDAFANNEDIHERTARFLFPSSEKISKEQRRIAKSVNFWVIYGITGFGLSKTLGTSPAQANEYIDAFFLKYPGVKAYYSDLLDHARQSGYVETHFGRRRYIPGLADGNKMMRAAAEREAMNAPIQGSAADIIKYAMVRIAKRLQEEKLESMLIMQVHDELVFEAPDKELPKLHKIVEEEMQGILKHEKVTLTVDIGSGKDWLAAK